MDVARNKLSAGDALDAERVDSCGGAWVARDKLSAGDAVDDERVGSCGGAWVAATN